MTVAPAPEDRRPLGRTATLLGLVVLAVLALRGRMPDAGPGDPDPTAESSPATLAGILILLSASMLITAIALLTAPPRRERPVQVEERRLPGGSGVWSLRRLLLLAIGVASTLLLVVLLRTQLATVPLPGVSAPPELPAPDVDRAGSVVRPDKPPAPEDDVFGYLAATVAAMAVLMVLSAVVARRRGRVPPLVAGLEAGDPAGPQALVVAAQRGLAAVEDLSRSPREAIIACYLAMETALAGAPGAAPQESDTPSEVLARAVGTRAVRPESAAPLVEVFAEARFSTHTMTEDHRDAAEHALRAVLGDLRGPS